MMRVSRVSRAVLTLAMVLAYASRLDAGLATWTSQGPEGGWISALAIAPTDPSTLYAGSGTFDRSLFKSTDGGARWVNLVHPKPSTGFNDQTVVVDPLTPNTVYVAGDGIFKSTNGGTSWMLITDGLSVSYFSTLAIDPSNPLTLYTASGSTVLKSLDGGGSWDPVGEGLITSGIKALAIDPLSATTIYAGTASGGVFKSTNGGTTWSATNTGLTVMDIESFAIDPVIAGTLYVATASGVFKSTNGGMTWSKANTGIIGGIITAVAIDSTTPTTVYAGSGYGVFKSTDGGTSWTSASYGMANRTVVSAIVLHPTNPSTLYAGTFSRGGGVYKSTTAAENWNAASNGMVATDVHAIAMDPSAPRTLWAGTSIDGIFKTTNGGTSWRAVNEFLFDHSFRALAVHPIDGNTVYAGTMVPSFATFELYRTTTAGVFWNSITEDLDESEIAAIAIDPITTSTMYVGTYGEGVFKSTDGGQTWVSSSTGLSTMHIATVVIDPTDTDRIYAGGAFGGLFKSTDGAANWIELGSVGPAVAIDPASSSVLYAGANSGTARSTDGGVSWTYFPGELPGFNVAALAASRTTPTVLYAGVNYHGVFRSTNGGVDWTPFNEGFPTAPQVRALIVDPGDSGTVYAATSRGVFGIGQALVTTPTPTPSFTPPRRTATATPLKTTTPTPTLTPSGTRTPTPTPEASPEAVATSVPPHGCCTTAGSGGGATPEDPVETRVCVPAGGTCAITEARAAGTPPTGYSIVGQAITISAPPGTVDEPLVLVFTIDGSQLPAGQALIAVQILRNGDVVRTCAGGSGQAVPDPCVARRRLVAGDLELTVLTSAASVWNPVVSSLDALLCYGAKTAKGASPFTPALGTRFVDVAVTLRSGPFFTQAATTFDLVKAGAFCAPVGVDGGAIVRPAVGFQEYLLKTPKTCSDDGRRCAKAVECNPGATCDAQARKVCADDGNLCAKTDHCTAPAKCVAHKKFLATADVALTSVLGQMVLHLGKPSGALIPTARTTTGPLPAGAPVDRYKCYDVKPAKDVCIGAPVRTCSDDAGCGDDGPCFRGFAAGRTLRLDDDLTPAPKAFVVKKPTALCVPANAGTAALGVAATVLQCFAVKGAVGEAKHIATTLTLQNDFGPLVRTTAKEGELCLPAEAIVKGLP